MRLSSMGSLRKRELIHSMSWTDNADGSLPDKANNYRENQIVITIF
ncbi:hypothetical protein ACFL6N_01965 [Thermodesulfobacteriota bacterium]